MLRAHYGGKYIRNFRKFSQQPNSILPPLLRNTFYIGGKVAVIDDNGVHNYEDLAIKSMQLTRQLLNLRKNLDGERVVFLTPNDASFVISKWAAWLTGAIGVPLCKTHPPKELAYVLSHSKPKIAITTPEYYDMMSELVKPIGADLITVPKNLEHDGNYLFEVGNCTNDGAMLLYTSGTTGPPKGVLWTHSSLKSQVDMMIHAWNWTKNDTLLHVLPLHHYHGLVNALMCPLSIGATVIMKNKFLPEQVWDHFLGKMEGHPNISVFTAVPTIYAKLLEYFEKHHVEKSDEIERKCKEIRLMMSGSSALPLPLFEKWRKVTSHALLERYGMTETGMVLTNTYFGDRIPECVGRPFPGMEAKITGENNETIAIGSATAIEEKVKGQQGELFVKGPIFEKYWRHDDVTTGNDAINEEGWFQTGDTAAIKNGSFKIVGRTSVDIIKSGGYKISALQVERHLLEHQDIFEVAVLGVPDEIWGEKVGAVISLKNSKHILNISDVKAFCESRMPPYAIPSIIKILAEIPKNAMGKVNKKQLVDVFSISDS